MDLTNPRSTRRKLAAALCTTFLVSSICLLSTTNGDTANLENDIHNSNGGSHKDNPTRSPIKHVIILIVENRSFDHLFGLYKPKGEDQTISNLLSKGIVNADGTPGPNYYRLAQQYSVAPQPSYYSTA